MSSRHPKKILQNQFFVPFGRFRLGRKRPRDETSVLVGRESERAFLIDALTGIGEQGSFLVTGRRGVGKTTFVDSCLEEYEHNVFRRFLGSGVGRKLADFLLVFGFAVALIVVLLSASEMLEFLVAAYSQNRILLFPIIVCLGIVLLPLVLGILTLLRAYEASWRNSPRFWASFSAIVSLGIGVFFPPFASPAQAASLLVLTLGLLSFFGSAFYFFRRSLFDCPKEARNWAWRRFIFLNFLAPLLMSFSAAAAVGWATDGVLGCSILSLMGVCGVPDGLIPGVARAYVLGSIGFGLVVGQYLANAFLINRQKEEPGGAVIMQVAGRSLKRALLICALSMIALHGYALSTGVFAPGIVLVSLFVLLIPLLTTWMMYHAFWQYPGEPSAKNEGASAQKDKGRWVFAPPVESLLLFKAFALIVLSLQLAYPISGLSRADDDIIASYSGENRQCGAVEWAERFVAGSRPSVDFGCSDLRQSVAMASLGLREHLPWKHKKLHPIVQIFVPAWWETKAVPLFERDFLMADYVGLDEATEAARSDASYAPFDWLKLEADRAVLEAALIQPTHFTLFRVGSDEAHVWAVLIVVLLAMIFLMEYDWINRPFVNQRQPRALDRGPRRSFMAHHHLDPLWYERTKAAEHPYDPKKPEQDPYRQNFQDVTSAKCLADEADEQGHPFSVRNRLQRKALNRFRLLESATFPFFVIRLLLPLIVVRVNLGFDSLDHRGVTQAMLYGLRETYFRTFVSSKSPYQLVSVFTRIALVLVLVVLIGRSLIDIPPVSAVGVEWTETAVTPIRDAASTGNSGTIADFVDFDDSSPSVGRLDVMTASNADQARQDVCVLLNRITWTRIDNLYGTSLVPRLSCLLPAGIGSGLVETLFLPVVQFQTHKSLTPDQSKSLGTSLLLYNFVHFNYGLPEFFFNEAVLEAVILGDDPPIQTWVAQWPSLTVRVYHLVVGYLLWVVLTRIGKLGLILPYRRNYHEISELLDALTLSRSDQKAKSRRFSLPSFFGASGDATRTEGYETSRDALEPRSVELALLTLLNDIRGNVEGRGRVASLTVPKPDLHFVFDELDKLGGLVGSEQTQYGVAEVDKVAVDADRRRTYQLHALFSDMKRVISAAPARFIFVGGRVLHDEWIRDQNRQGSRQPLLTSIFDHEIYLPSLLVDFPRDRFENSLLENKVHMPNRSLDLRIEEFIISAYIASRALQDNLRPTRLLSIFGLNRMESTAIRFGDHDIRTGADAFVNMQVIDGRTELELDHSENEKLFRLGCVRRDEFFAQFKGFMAYRSAGSPKKLRELLGDLIHPSGSFAFPGIDLDNRVTESRDVMMVDEKALYRIQLIDTVFRHVEASFGTDLLQRDDKITINTIFIIDFLMKMHDRAFSWSSIERLDELAHIHRAPDLRRLFDSVVANSAERFFHRVLNGLYVFRFRSELAVEIRYLSRISQAEMAALNFTLDESQELKTTFTNMLNSSGEANPDLLLALGELYEFDQAYDVARGFFERALRMIDDDCVRSFGATLVSDAPDAVNMKARGGLLHNVSIETNSPAMTAWGSEPMSPLRAVLTDQKAGRELIRTQLSWALRHLRIMLQIGLTYEQSGDEERAQTQYHAAQVFAAYILKAALEVGEEDRATVSLKQVLKHLSVIFQPVFASAWIAEKLENGVDTSLSIVERELTFLRSKLPFVSNRDAVEEESLDEFFKDGLPKAPDGGSNHALVVAELHNKAGDLYFFKGRSAYPVRGREFVKALELEEQRNQTNHANSNGSNSDSRNGLEGYLYRAHYHYAVALHEVRRYVVYRHNMSKARLNILGSPQDGWNTHNEVTLPSFVALTAYSSLVDLAEVTLARSSLLSIWRKLALRSYSDFENDLKDHHAISVGVYNPEMIGNAFRVHRVAFDAWFYKSNSKTRWTKDAIGPRQPVETLLHDFLGGWVGEAQGETLVSFDRQNSGLNRILVALFADLAGARFANRANYPDTASFEHQICAEHCVALIRNAQFIMTHMKVSRSGGSEGQREEIKELFDTLSPNVNHVKFLTVLIDIAIFAIERQVDLVGLAYPQEPTFHGRDSENSDEKLGNKGRATLVPLVSTVCELRLLVASLTASFEWEEGFVAISSYRAFGSRLKRLDELTNQVVSEKILKNIDAFLFDQNETLPTGFDKWMARRHRREARALLIYLVTHYRYPALANISALKALVDDTLAVDGVMDRNRHGAETRREEAYLWIDEILDMEKVLDAPMHFPPASMAETLTLAAVVRRIDANESKQDLKPVRNVENLARKFRWRAEQTYTMGRQYYRNVSRLVYLYDDFNDRRRHANQARQMCFADLLALYRMILDRRDEGSGLS